MRAARLRAKLAAGEPLAVIDGFALYPRPLRPKNFERGQGDVGTLLDHVAVLKRESDFDVRLVPRLQSGLADQTQFNRVGVVPVVHDHTELSWLTLGTNRYHVEENVAFSSVIAERLHHAMSEMCGTNTQLVLMPELVSGPSLRHAVSTHLGERFGRGEGTPVVTLCGTCLKRDGDSTRNQATVLDSEGDVVWTQNKLHAYEFLATDQSALGLPLGMDPRNRREAIDITPSSLAIVDLSASLRVVVLICEDLIQRPPHALAIEQMGVTTILSPIMDKTRDLIPGTNVPDFGWLKDGALAYVRHPGASTFVANSGTLVREYRDLHWSYALAFTVPRHVHSWQPVPSAEAAEPPVGWVLSMS